MAKRLRNWQNGAGYSTGKYSVKIKNEECKGDIRSVSDAKIDICIYFKKTCLGASTAFLQGVYTYTPMIFQESLPSVFSGWP